MSVKIGPRYRKSLRDLLKGPLGIGERKDVVRYRALQKLGLVDGVGIRCVSLTKNGKDLLTTGEYKEPPVDEPEFTPHVPAPFTSWF